MEFRRTKNVDTRIVFPIMKNDGTFITGAAGLDSEYALIGAHGGSAPSFADCTHEATEIGSTGLYYLDVSAAEINDDYAVIQVKSSSTGAVTQVLLINTTNQPADVQMILGHLLTQTGTQLADGFQTFFDVASPTTHKAITGVSLAADQAVNVTKVNGTAQTARDLGAALPAAAPGANGGLPTTNGTKINQTADLTAGQSIACSDKTGFSLSATGADLILKGSTFIQAIVAAINEFATYGLTAIKNAIGSPMQSTAKPTVGGYDTGQDPATLLLVTPANKINTDAANAVKIQKMAVTLAPADVSGNIPADLKAITVGVDLSATMKSSVTAAVPTASAIATAVRDVDNTSPATDSLGEAVNSASTGGISASDIRNAVGLASANLDTQLSGINAKTTNLPSDPADESLIIAATDAIMTRIGVAGAGLTALGDTRLANLDATVSSRLASAGYTAPPTADVAAIKAKTDKLTFTSGNDLDANVQKINDTALTGDGSSGTPWGPA